MTIRHAFRDTRAVTSIEFALTAPLFILIIFGLLQFGLWIWAQFALQHATAMAARCASINTTTCGSTSQIQTYAAQQALGLNVSPSIFEFNQPSKPPCGNQVTANYIFPAFAPALGLPSLTLTAQACFPSS